MHPRGCTQTGFNLHSYATDCVVEAEYPEYASLQWTRFSHSRQAERRLVSKRVRLRQRASERRRDTYSLQNLKTFPASSALHIAFFLERNIKYFAPRCTMTGANLLAVRRARSSKNVSLLAPRCTLAPVNPPLVALTRSILSTLPVSVSGSDKRFYAGRQPEKGKKKRRRPFTFCVGEKCKHRTSSRCKSPTTRTDCSPHGERNRTPARRTSRSLQRTDCTY